MKGAYILKSRTLAVMQQGNKQSNAHIYEVCLPCFI